MKVFKISGKFQQYDRWSELDADFIGYFAKEDGSDVFTGYMEEQYDSPSSPIRYIKGLYNEEKNNIVFLKMTNDSELSPLVYTFPNLAQKGVWTGYSLFFGGFFPMGHADGYAKVTIEEVTENVAELAKKIEETYAQVLDVGLKINMDLMEDIEEYKIYLDIEIPE